MDIPPMNIAYFVIVALFIIIHMRSKLADDVSMTRVSGVALVIGTICSAIAFLMSMYRAVTQGEQYASDASFVLTAMTHLVVAYICPLVLIEARPPSQARAARV